MRNVAIVIGMLMAGSALAQTPPPAHTPPGTPSTNTSSDQINRNNAGQQVIGHTTTPPTAVPGNTGGQGTGTTKP